MLAHCYLYLYTTVGATIRNRWVLHSNETQNAREGETASSVSGPPTPEHGNPWFETLNTHRPFVSHSNRGFVCRQLLSVRKDSFTDGIYLVDATGNNNNDSDHRTGTRSSTHV
mmetsp:Transcript_11985/g.25328  ORF Transcript_11985/g.25328 Transcript_11985/m.25328 type:complete len:113 (-) Transcript_11985:944-1282(-)